MGTLCALGGVRRAPNRAMESIASGLAKVLVPCGVSLICGGDRRGIIGYITNQWLDCGGKVVGVIPESYKHFLNQRISDVRLTASLGARRDLMYEMSDLFVFFPGGLGTLVELFDVLCGIQDQAASKRCVLIDVGDYFAPVSVVLSRICDEGWADHEIAKATLILGGEARQIVEAIRSLMCERVAALPK
jgi:uncharacterized protein (TIGR00730 family)